MYFSTDNLVAIIVAIIGGGAIVIAASIPLLISIRKHVKSTANDSKKALYAVVNDHTKPLRNDLDDKFKGLENVLNDVNLTLSKLVNRDKILARRIALNKSNIDKNYNKVTEIEALIKDAINE